LSCVFDSCGESELLNSMHFWQEVTDCELHKDSTGDRQVRASQAWDIFNKYISPDAVCSVGERACAVCYGHDTGP